MAVVGRACILASYLVLLASSVEFSAATTRRETERLVEVNTKNGILVGQEVTGADGLRFNAFRGVPYALPPVASLRFKNPREPLSWTGPRTALVEGAECPQYRDGRITGQEDCLYLNVYSRHLGESAKQPVMVYFCGGGYGYCSGTATETGPDFLVRNDVVFVTMNYRLNVFGFLNLDNDDVPGNMGLKDQRAALQWVKENIAAFGGNPKEVTIFGQSSGASSTHYHTLVKASAGLFKRAILQSGNALAPTSYQENHIDMARQLSVHLGNNNPASLESVASTIHGADTKAIMAASRLVVKKPGFNTFGPSPERRALGVEDIFLTRDPESLVRQPEVSPVPVIIGLTGLEGIYFYYKQKLDRKPQVVADYAVNPAQLVGPTVAPFPDTARILGVSANQSLSARQLADINARIKEEYKLSGRGDDNFIKFYSDVSSGVTAHRLINLTLADPRRHEAPVYLYHFLEDGDYNWGKVSNNITAKGASHTDELGYLMHITSPKNLKQTVNGTTKSSKTLRLLTKLWTDFAKSGQPATPQLWPAATGSAATAVFARISADSWGLLGAGLAGPHVSLWDDIYSLLRRM